MLVREETVKHGSDKQVFVIRRDDERVTSGPEVADNSLITFGDSTSYDVWVLPGA